jgi:uncharacterized membrane protein
MRARLRRFVDALGRPERAFLVLALAYCLPFFLLYPPFQAPDEPYHFYRAYQISEGQLSPIAPGELDVPTSLVMVANAFNHLPFQPQHKTSWGQIRAQLARPLESEARTRTMGAWWYPPTAYAPQALAIAIGRLFGAGPLWLFYLARLAGLAFALAVIHYALRIAPALQRSLLVIALLPMTLAQLSSLSADVQLISCSFLLIALLLRLIFDDGARVDRRTFVWLAVVAALVTLAKPFYLAPLALLLAVDPRKAGGRARLVGAFAAIATIAVGIWFGWSEITTRVSFHGAPTQETIVAEQPGRFLSVMISNFNTKGYWYLETFIGKAGWLDVALPPLLVFFCLVFLVIVILTDTPPVEVRAWTRFLAAASYLAAMIGISYVMYLVYTPVGSGAIEGIQGRYLIPVAPLAALAMANRRIRVDAPPETVTRVVGAVWTAVLALTLLVTYARYYVS